MFSSFANALNPGFIDLFIHVHLLFTMKVVNTICLGVPIYFKIVCGWSRDPSSGLCHYPFTIFPFQQINVEFLAVNYLEPKPPKYGVLLDVDRLDQD